MIVAIATSLIGLDRLCRSQDVRDFFPPTHYISTWDQNQLDHWLLIHLSRFHNYMTPDLQPLDATAGSRRTLIVRVIFSAMQALHSSTVHTGCSCIALFSKEKEKENGSHIRTIYFTLMGLIGYWGMPSGKCVPNEVHGRAGAGV
jgi:hypothetical protein